MCIRRDSRVWCSDRALAYLASVMCIGCDMHMHGVYNGLAVAFFVSFAATVALATHAVAVAFINFCEDPYKQLDALYYRASASTFEL